MLELLSTSSEIVGPWSPELANLGTRSRVATSRGRGQTSVNKRDSAEVELKEIVEQLKMKHPDLPLASFSYFSYPRRFCPNRSDRCRALMLTCETHPCGNVVSTVIMFCLRFGRHGSINWTAWSSHGMCVNWNEPQVSRMQLLHCNVIYMLLPTLHACTSEVRHTAKGKIYASSRSTKLIQPVSW